VIPGDKGLISIGSSEVKNKHIGCRKRIIKRENLRKKILKICACQVCQGKISKVCSHWTGNRKYKYKACNSFCLCGELTVWSFFLLINAVGHQKKKYISISTSTKILSHAYSMCYRETRLSKHVSESRTITFLLCSKSLLERFPLSFVPYPLCFGFGLVWFGSLSVICLQKSCQPLHFYKGSLTHVNKLACIHENVCD